MPRAAGSTSPSAVGSSAPTSAAPDQLGTVIADVQAGDEQQMARDLGTAVNGPLTKALTICGFIAP